MAIGVQQDFEATLDQYDTVIARLGLTPGGVSVPGSISHHVVETASGFRVVDVWESEEAFLAFAQGTIAPIAQELGVAPPTVVMFDVHNYLTTPH